MKRQKIISIVNDKKKNSEIFGQTINCNKIFAKFLFEISEHIIGSFLTTLNSSGILNNVYLRETRSGPESLSRFSWELKGFDTN